MARISFLLPIYNGEAFLDETLESCLEQTYGDYDIVAIDDGSTDRTAEVIERYDHPKLRYYRKENGGLVSALNYGLEQMDCQFVARIDADDICLPHRLASQLDFLNFTRAEATSCKAYNIDISGNALWVNAPEEEFHKATPHYFPAKEPYLPHPFMMVKRALFERLDGYRDAHLAEDSDLCWRMIEDTRVAIQAEVLGMYRLHHNSISNASPVTGRVQAFYSQLAALNVIRRKEGQKEIPYTNTIFEAKQLGTFEALFAFHKCEKLPEDQLKYLRAATAMKFFDIASWRHHTADPEDLAFAEDALRDVDPNEENREKIRNLMERLRERQPELFETAEEAEEKA